jgi:uncharacterized protein (TIGR02996 family)
MDADAPALLRTVCESPDDDAPRLIYADWLDDSGDTSRVARAEFIRLQIRLEGITAGDPMKAVFERRAWQVLHDHNPAWLRPMGMKLWGVRYRRGFIERATTRSDFILADPAWFALQPIVNLEIQLDSTCWQLVLDAIGRLERTENDNQLDAAWMRLRTNDPRPTLIEAGNKAATLGWHPLIQRVAQLSLSVDWQVRQARFGRDSWTRGLRA